MSELRLNILNSNWTVIAPERGKKPVRLKQQDTHDIRILQPHDKDCPFCPGNEGSFEILPLAGFPSNDGNWQSQLIENKYKIFDNYNSCSVILEKFSVNGIHPFYQGCGNHYLVIEHRLHNKVMGEMSSDEVGNVFRCYQEAVKRIAANSNNLISIIFKNQGARAGGSQPHAHSQIVGSRVVPAWIRTALYTQQRYFDEKGICAMCDMLSFEKSTGARVLSESGNTLVISPFAASTPYEIWVIPKRHLSRFQDLSYQDLEGLAIGLRTALQFYIQYLGNPDFNFYVHGAPNPLGGIPYYHLYIQLLPRLKTPGGFEIGTGIAVNTVPPETLKESFERFSN